MSSRRLVAAAIGPLFFNIFKPEGESSFETLSNFKKLLDKDLKVGKIGHMGTLDPFASGVLVVGVAGAARLNFLFQKSFQKQYLLQGIIGQKTDTADKTGTIINQNTNQQLLEIQKLINGPDLFSQYIQKFQKEKYRQLPPMYSAIKHKGRPLYKYAREGVEIKRELVDRVIFDLGLIACDFPKISLKVTSSSGTYMRTLFEDLLALFSAYGHLEGLQRMSIGPLSVKESIRLDRFAGKKLDLEKLYALSISPVDLFKFQQIHLDEQQKISIRNGRSLNISKFNLAQGPVWGICQKGHPLSFMECDQKSAVPKIVFTGAFNAIGF